MIYARMQSISRSNFSSPQQAEVHLITMASDSQLHELMDEQRFVVIMTKQELVELQVNKAIVTE